MKSRRLWLTLTVWLLMLTAGAQSSVRPQLSPLVRRAVAEAEHWRVRGGAASYVESRGEKPRHTSLAAFVRLADEADETVLADYGCQVLARMGGVHVVSIPLQHLPALSRERRIQRIEAGEQCSIQLDTTLLCVNALPAHSGLALPQAFTGRGVVLGIQDIGFDLTHPTFYSPDLTEYRIKAFWDQLSTDTLQSALYVGRDYTSPEDVLASTHSYDGVEQGHGTLTLSIAAGSGYRSPYRGVAWESDLCAVANATSNNAHLIDSLNLYKYTSATDALGFKYIFDYASSVGKPCVITFSEGSHQDFYGDNELFYEALEALTGPGRILVASAGNDGRYLSYVHKPAGRPSAGTFIYSSDTQFYSLMRADKPFDLRAVVYSAQRDTVTYRLAECWQTMAVGDTLEITDTLALHDGEYVFQLAGYPSYYDEGLTAYELLVTAPHHVGGGGVPMSIELLGGEADVELFRHHGTFLSDNLNASLSDAEEGRFTVLSPGSAPSVICVGATAYRTSTVNEQGEPFVLDYGNDGRRARYSAIGPTFDGRIKPDVMAPGTNVISAINSYYLEAYPEGYTSSHALGRFTHEGRTYAWTPESGTSMSTPVVGGAIALWLQANPTLTPQQVMSIIEQTSHRVTGDDAPMPNNQNGYGEIDVYQGLLCAFYGGFDHIPSVLSRHQPRQVAFSVSGEELVLTFSSPLKQSARLRFYTAAGQLLTTVVVPPGNSVFRTQLSALPHCVMAVQLHSNDPLVSGSSLIRY